MDNWGIRRGAWRASARVRGWYGTSIPPSRQDSGQHGISAFPHGLVRSWLCNCKVLV